jgi:plasmid stabilization system protein ParE
LALPVPIKPRAQREIERAADWWAENRSAAPGAIRRDVEAAVALLAEHPGIGSTVETHRAGEVTRRRYLHRIRYFVYYRVVSAVLEIVSRGKILVSMKVDLIIAISTRPVEAAMQATQLIPILTSRWRSSISYRRSTQAACSSTQAVSPLMDGTRAACTKDSRTTQSACCRA